MMDVEIYLAAHIPHAQDICFSGEDFLMRTKALAEALGDPQEKCKVVHIAGTSGKGSTAFMITTLLVASGQKTGLFTSPHLISVRERFVIDDEMISEEKFLQYFVEIKDAAESLRDTQCGMPSYFEILTVLAYHIFAQEGCCYAVMETGIGGRCDATNIAQRSDKVVVITPIGLDHTKILGETIDLIATEKAGIIHEDNLVFIAPQNAIARDIVRDKTLSCNAQIILLRKNDISDIDLSEEGTRFTWKNRGETKEIAIKQIGICQAYNAALAISVADSLSERDQFALCDINKALSKKIFSGRFDIRKRAGKTVILDGAHNPQKMTALVESFMKLYPHEKCTVVFAAKEKKDYKAMLTLLAPITCNLIITQFGNSEQDYQSSSVDTDILTKEAKMIGYTDLITAATVETALEKAQKQGNKKILVTGSLYLVGKMQDSIK